MFWKYNTTSSAQIETLLAKEDVTLQELLDSEDIISECRVQNKNLIDFLLRPEVMEELVTLTTREPSAEINEKTRFKYPNVASELLTCDVAAINERLAGDERLLEKLYEFLEIEPPLNPLLASYFSKIMGGLIAKKTEQVLDFLKARDTFLPLLMKHLGTSAIMDLMLKLMTQVEGVEMRQNILNWLDSQKIIQRLVCLLSPKIEKGRHDNVAQLLCDFLRTARDTQRNCTERSDPDPLLSTLESAETVNFLLDQMFDEDKCESSIVGGISVLMALLNVNQTSILTFRSAGSLANNMYNSNINEDPADMEEKQKVINSTTEAIASRIQDFHDLLLKPPKHSVVPTTVCFLDPPVGHTRLQVVRLLATLVSSNQHTQLYDKLIELNTFTVLLDLFFQYPWNNFLHTQVENCIIAVLENGTSIAGETGDEGGGESKISPLCRHLIDSCNLIERIMKAWKDNDEQQLEKQALRQGYMGHLISIVNNLIRIQQNSCLGDCFKEIKPDTYEAFEEFKVTNLADVMEQQEKLLGGLHPSSIMEDNDEFGDIPFPQSSALQQQSFSQYQTQNLTSQYIDGYSGFNDDAFNDGDDTLQTIDNPSDINFDLSESELMQRDALFKQVCAQSINTLFDADDQIFDEKDHTFQTVIEKKDQGDIGENSSDSDDDDPSDTMDVDPWSSPKTDPWSTLATSATSSEQAQADWADFSAAAFGQPPAFTAAFSDRNTSETVAEQKPKETSEFLSENSAFAANFSDPQETRKKEPLSEDVSNVPVKEEASSRTVEKEETVESAAAGDHELKPKTESSNSEQQPSISLEGDSCNFSTKPVEKSPDKPIEKTVEEKV